MIDMNTRSCDEQQDLVPITEVQDEVVVANQGVSLNEAFDRISGLTSTICDSITSWKQIDCQMHEMDIQFETFSKQIDASLEIHRQNAPIVSKQLDAISNMMSRILDKVLTMDASSENEINDKMRLMDSVDQYVERITTIMTKLL